MRRTFWMVLGGREPTFRHESRSSAKDEAERLAKLYPGTEFWVLEAMGCCKKTDIAWESCDEEASEGDIPF